MENFVKDLQENRMKNLEKMKHQKEENIQANISRTEEESFSIFNPTEEAGEVKVIPLENGGNIKSEINFKIIVIGNSSVGKSSLVDRATKNRFLEEYNATIGFDFCSFYINYDYKIIKLQIWDTCGQEIYQSLITNFYRNSSLAIMVYAINDRKSFENLDNWLKELKRESNPDAKIILIGNKADLDKERVVSYEEAEKYAKDFKFNSFFETSAKTGFNAQKVFINAALTLYEDFTKYRASENYTENDNEKSKKGSTSLIRRNKSKNGKCC